MAPATMAMSRPRRNKRPRWMPLAARVLVARLGSGSGHRLHGTDGEKKGLPQPYTKELRRFYVWNSKLSLVLTSGGASLGMLSTILAMPPCDPPYPPGGLAVPGRTRAEIPPARTDATGSAVVSKRTTAAAAKVYLGTPSLLNVAGIGLGIAAHRRLTLPWR